MKMKRFLFLILCSFCFSFTFAQSRFFNRFDMSQYVIEDSLILERFQTYVPDSIVFNHIKIVTRAEDNQIIQLGENEYMFRMPFKDKIILKYNEDHSKAIITNFSTIRGMGLHFFEFTVKDNERRQVLYYDDDNVLCGIIYDKFYRVAKYFHHEKKDIGRRMFNRMRKSFRNI